MKMLDFFVTEGARLTVKRPQLKPPGCRSQKTWPARTTKRSVGQRRRDT